MANLTPLIQKRVKDTGGNYSLAAVVCVGGDQLFLNLLRGQLEKCNLNIDSQPEGFYEEGFGKLEEREKERKGVARSSLFSYFKALNSLKG